VALRQEFQQYSREIRAGLVSDRLGCGVWGCWDNTAANCRAAESGRPARMCAGSITRLAPNQAGIGWLAGNTTGISCGRSAMVYVSGVSWSIRSGFREPPCRPSSDTPTARSLLPDRRQIVITRIRSGPTTLLSPGHVPYQHKPKSYLRHPARSTKLAVAVGAHQWNTAHGRTSLEGDVMTEALQAARLRGSDSSR
jgi:hypothetical protein